MCLGGAILPCLTSGLGQRTTAGRARTAASGRVPPCPGTQSGARPERFGAPNAGEAASPLPMPAPRCRAHATACRGSRRSRQPCSRSPCAPRSRRDPMGKRLTPALRGRAAPHQVLPVGGGAVDGLVPDEGQTRGTAVLHFVAVGEEVRSRGRVLPTGDLGRGVTDCKR